MKPSKKNVDVYKREINYYKGLLKLEPENERYQFLLKIITKLEEWRVSAKVVEAKKDIFYNKIESIKKEKEFKTYLVNKIWIEKTLDFWEENIYKGLHTNYLKKHLKKEMWLTEFLNIPSNKFSKELEKYIKTTFLNFECRDEKYIKSEKQDKNFLAPIFDKKLPYQDTVIKQYILSKLTKNEYRKEVELLLKTYWYLIKTENLSEYFESVYKNLNKEFSYNDYRLISYLKSKIYKKNWKFNEISEDIDLTYFKEIKKLLNEQILNFKDSKEIEFYPVGETFNKKIKNNFKGFKYKNNLVYIYFTKSKYWNWEYSYLEKAYFELISHLIISDQKIENLIIWVPSYNQTKTISVKEIPQDLWEKFHEFRLICHEKVWK